MTKQKLRGRKRFGVAKAVGSSQKCRQQIAVLEQQLSLLSAKAFNATVRHSSLQARSIILGSWLSVLDLLQHVQHSNQPLQHSNEPLPRNEQHVQDLSAELQQELQLLLGLSPLPAPATTRGGHACTDPLLETIASPVDSVSYFRDLALRPLAPGIETMTALQHLEQHRSLAMQLSVNLHRLELDAPHQHEIMDTIKQLLDRHYHTLWSLVVCGKRDVADATKLFNLETGTLLSHDSPLLDNQESIKTTLLPALQLSEAQEDQAAYVMEVCESLMAPISAEIAQIQEQLDACVASSSAALCGTAGASEPSSAAAGHAAAEGPEHASARALLEQQQQLLSRLSVVLRKQYHVTAGSTSIFLGGLTWVQAAKMVVYRWPFSASMQYVAKAVWLTQRERIQWQYDSMDSPGGSNTAAAMAAAAVARKGRSMLAAVELLPPRQGCAIEGSSSAKTDWELPALKFSM